MNEIFSKLFEDSYNRRKDILIKLSEKDIIFLTAQELIEINKRIMQIHKGIHGIRDENVLHSCVDAVVNHFKYQEQYLDKLKLSLILFEKIIKNHPFIDGNKRTSIIAFDMFLELNNETIWANLSNDTLYQWAIEIAKNKTNYEKIFFYISYPNKKILKI